MYLLVMAWPPRTLQLQTQPAHLAPAQADFDKVGEFVARAVAIAVALKKSTGPKLKDFREALAKWVVGCLLLMVCGVWVVAGEEGRPSGCGAWLLAGWLRF